MTTFLKRSVVLAADTQQPLLTDILKDIIDPAKITQYDLFDGAAGSINSRALTDIDGSASSKTWTSSGISLDGSGEIVASGSNRIAYIDADDADCEVQCVVDLQNASGTYAGVVVRYVDSNNYLFAWLGASGSFTLQRKTAGSSATLATTTFTIEFGRKYNIKVKADGNNITATIKAVVNGVDDYIVLTGTNSENPTSTKVGVYFSAAGQKIDSFYVR